MDPLTAVRYPSVTMVLSPPSADVTGVRAGLVTRHSGGSEEKAGAGRRRLRARAMVITVMAISVTHSGGAGAAQWSDTRTAPGGVIICNGSNPDPPIMTTQHNKRSIYHPIRLFLSVSMIVD